MSEEGTDTGATGGAEGGDAAGGDAAANADANTNTDAGGGAAGGSGGDGDGGDAGKTGGEGEDGKKVTPDFVLPDEFKDKPWAEKVKSQADLYKQVDNLSTLAGKKNAYPQADATPEQLTEYYQGLRPESADKYDFGENHPQPEVAKQFGEMLFKANVSEHQSKQLIADYNAHEKAIIEEATSEEGFKEIMTKQFGEKYDGVVTRVSKSLEEYVSKESQDVLNAMPNKYLGAMYEYGESLLKAYGANEGGDDLHNQKGGKKPAGVDIDTQRANIRQEIRDLEKGMHTVDQKQALVDKLQNTYTNTK